MSIEFPCSRCGALLRTPEDTAGRRAKCPQCEHIMQVPEIRDSSEATPRSGSWDRSDEDREYSSQRGDDLPPQTAENPFADTAPLPRHGQAAASDNPYATPGLALDAYAAGGGSHQPLTHRQIGFRETLSATWAVFTRNLAFLVLVALILTALVLAVYGVAVISVAGLFFAMMQGDLAPVGVVIALPLFILFAVGLLVGYSWIEAGLAMVSVGLCRGSPVEFSHLFAGGPFVVRVILLNLVRGLISFGISMVMGFLAMVAVQASGEEIWGLIVSWTANILNYYVTLLLLLATYFVVDRGEGVSGALSSSIEYMHGNKATVFGLHIVTGIVAFVVVVGTCGIGALFVVPFILLLTAMIYLQATGQPVAG